MVCAPAFAHHGTGSSYDSNKTITVAGVVDEFIWANPHSQLYINVTDAQGTVVRWGIEMNSPGVLARAGWTKRRLKPGDKVTLTMHIHHWPGTIPTAVFRSIVRFPTGPPTAPPEISRPIPISAQPDWLSSNKLDVTRLSYWISRILKEVR